MIGGGGGLGLSLSAPSAAVGGTASAEGGEIYMVNFGGGAQSAAGGRNSLAVYIAVAAILFGAWWLLRRLTK